jgi:hypothetical protein
MSDIIAAGRSGQLESRGGRGIPMSRQTSRALAQLGDRTLIRMATVQAEGMVQGEKVREVDHLAREAMTGQTMLRKWADTLAGADPMLHDELRFFSDMARIGCGEIIADTIDTFCRESRS